MAASADGFAELSAHYQCDALYWAPRSCGTSPPQFLQLVHGALGGYIVFGDAPNIWIVTGGATVIAANAFLLFAHNEGTRAQASATGELTGRH
jgi:hypothetical protein